MTESSEYFTFSDSSNTTQDGGDETASLILSLSVICICCICACSCSSCLQRFFNII